MQNEDSQLRQQAEKTASIEALLLPENLEAMTLAESRLALHELQVHRIELEMQNEELRRTQAELDAARARYFDLYDLAPVGYCIISEDGLILETNLTAAKLLGMARSRLTGHTISRFVLPDDQNIYYLHRKRLFDTRETQVFELRMQKADGTVFWAHLEASAVQDADGAAICRLILSDVTARKTGEEKLKEGEERYRVLFEHSGVAIGYYRPDGTVIFYNRKEAENMGGWPEDFTGRSIYELFPKSEADFYMERISAAVDLDSPQEYEDYASLPVGGRWFHSTFSRIMDFSGQVSGIQIVSQDITERKRAEGLLTDNEKKLKLQNGLFSSLLQLLPMGVFMVEAPSGTPLIANEKAYQLLGRGILPDATRHNLSEVYKARKLGSSDPYPPAEMPVMLGMQGESSYVDDMVVARPDGTETLLEVFGTPVTDDQGHIWASLVSFSDITERIKKQEEIRYLSYHDQLTGLYNRRFYEEELKRLDVPRNLPLTIAMGDVNGLKLINDSFGHLIGDELLQRVGQLIKDGCRADDIIARLGGDEFVIILPKTDGEKTEKMISRIKEMSQGEKIGSIDLSISFGYDTKTGKEENIQKTFKNAEDHMYRHKLSESSSMRSKTIDLIMNTLFEKNHREMLHSIRVSSLCEGIAVKMGFDNDDVVQIRIAGLMHDIGKIGVDEEILNKPGKLETHEWVEMKKHSEIGYRILSSVNEFSEIADYILEHHERWDGKGYPRGLAGADISLRARIIAVADAYDAMTTERTYSKALSETQAVDELRRCSGTQFDPDIVEKFLESYPMSGEHNEKKG